MPWTDRMIADPWRRPASNRNRRKRSLSSVEAAAAGEPVTDGSVPDVEEPQSHAKAEDPAERPASRRRAADDDEWNAWLDRLEAEGGTASAAMAVKEGLASSLSTAKRHLARIRRQRAERS